MICTSFTMVLLLISTILINGCKKDKSEKKSDTNVTVKLYKEIDRHKLNLHIFKSENRDKSKAAPVIVFFFGGGWTGGTPKQFFQYSKDFAEMGYVAISAEYRVKSKHNTTPFECVKDGKSVIRWVRQHAKELAVDPNKIVAAGGSAGGHVAACTGVIEGHDEEGEDLKVSSVPNAMILLNPVIDTTVKGYGAEKVKGRETEISPCHQVQKGIVPTITFHGTQDSIVPFENVERFTKLMKEAGNTAVLIPFEGHGHGFFNDTSFRPKNDPENYKKVLAESRKFLEEMKMFPK